MTTTAQLFIDRIDQQLAAIEANLAADPLEQRGHRQSLSVCLVCLAVAEFFDDPHAPMKCGHWFDASKPVIQVMRELRTARQWAAEACQ